MQLTDDAIFDVIDDEGIVLDSFSARYFQLNPVATLMLQASTKYETKEEVVEYLIERINATPDTLDAGLQRLAARLEAEGLLAQNNLGQYPEGDRLAHSS